jgi:hypothetical protein
MTARQAIHRIGDVHEGRDGAPARGEEDNA